MSRATAEQVHSLVDKLREAVRGARCGQCLGRGIVGHMGIGHDVCPSCHGKGESRTSDYNLVAALGDAIDALAQVDAMCNAAEAKGIRETLATLAPALNEAMPGVMT